MFSLYRPKLPDYQEKFRELSCINSRTTVASLVEGIMEPAKTATTPSYSLFSMWSAPPSNQGSREGEVKRVAKHLKHKLYKWCEEIDQELEFARYNPSLLERLKVVFQEIFEGSKITILEQKIEEASLPKEKLKSLLQRLDRLILRVINTPSLEKLTRPRRINRFPRNLLLPHFATTGLFGLPLPLTIITRDTLPTPSFASNGKRRQLKAIGRSKSLPNISIKPQNRTTEQTRLTEMEDLRREISKKEISLALESKVRKICIFDPSFGDHWRNLLVNSFKSLTEEQEILAVAKALNALQALNIITGILHDSKEEWKISLLLGSLDAQVFEECIPAFDDSQLTFLGDILCSGTKTQLEWLDKQFYRIRQWYIDTCNKTTSRINAMARRFRGDTEGNLLTPSDLQYIAELQETINLKMRAINEKLYKLIKRVPLHPETMHVLFEGVIKDYRVLLIRLKETRDYEERPAGCLFPIIFRNVFERAGVADEDEAYDIFGNWTLLYGKDFFDAGVFGNISFEEFKVLESKAGNIFIQMQTHLGSVGISKVADLKRLLIFNNHLLTCYLKDSKRAVLLGDFSREIITRK